MAQRRMFSKTITNSSNFLMMPQSSQNLYFHLGMNADDDGFCEHFTIMRMTESKPDDLKILQAKGLVVVFDERVLVIINWKENNFIRSDRYTASKYLEIYKNELKKIANIKDVIPNVIPVNNQMPYQMEPQVRLGKVSIDKDRIGEINKEENISPSHKKKIALRENVFLTQIEIDKLKEKYDHLTLKEYADRLSFYIGSKGKKYKSHYYTILSWMRKDNIPEKRPPLKCPECKSDIPNSRFCTKCGVYV
jgi:hypothetical protein